MNLLEKAFRELYPNKPLNFVPIVEYSGKFKHYRGNIRKDSKSITVRLSKEWKTVTPDIQIGIIQELLVKLYGKKVRTTNMDLYNHFLKSVHIAVPKTKTDPLLEESFRRVNRLYFHGMIDQPNLAWSNGTSTMGSYEYGADIIMISNLLKENLHLLDYVMFHEILHKKHKFVAQGTRHHSHTKAFREEEKAYPNHELLEKELERLSYNGKRKKARLRKFLGF